MAGLFSLFGARVRGEDHHGRPGGPEDDFWYSDAPWRNHAMEPVTIARARKLPVVRSCINVLADTMSMLSFAVFRREDHDSRIKVERHRLSRLMKNPNRRDTAAQFLRALVGDLASHGEFLAELVRPMTAGEEMYRIDPDHFLVEELPDRGVRFRVREPGKPERILLDEEVWFIAVPPFQSNVRGTSPILHDGAEAIGAAIALQNYANSFWNNDATPPLIFKHKANFADDASRKSFLASWRRWTTGRNRHKPAVLEYGMEPHQLSHTNEQAQFLETRKELWLDICRLWRVPPHKVGILDKATFSNIEHQSLEFVVDTLGPWLELIEQSAQKTFLTREDEYFEFNIASLLRGDIKTRFEAYALGRQWGFLSVNEIRSLENRNGIGRAGDRYIEPLNMVPVGTGDGGATPRDRDSAASAITFLRQSVMEHGGRPNLKVIDNVA